MQINTLYDVGDSVWTSIYTESDGLYHAFKRTMMNCVNIFVRKIVIYISILEQMEIQQL